MSQNNNNNHNHNHNHGHNPPQHSHNQRQVYQTPLYTSHSPLILNNGAYPGYYQNQGESFAEMQNAMVNGFQILKNISNQEMQEKLASMQRQIVFSGPIGPEEVAVQNEINGLLLLVNRNIRDQNGQIRSEVIENAAREVYTKINLIWQEYKNNKKEKEYDKKEAEIKDFIQKQKSKLEEELKIEYEKFTSSLKKDKEKVVNELSLAEKEVSLFKFHDNIIGFDDNKKIKDTLLNEQKTLNEIISELESKKFTNADFLVSNILDKLGQINLNVQKSLENAKKADFTVAQSARDFQAKVLGISDYISKPSDEGVELIKATLISKMKALGKMTKEDQELSFFSLIKAYFSSLFGFKHINKKIKPIIEKIQQIEGLYRKLNLKEDPELTDELFTEVKNTKKMISGFLANFHSYSSNLDKNEEIIVQDLLKALKTELTSIQENKDSLLSLFSVNLNLKDVNSILGKDYTDSQNYFKRGNRLTEEGLYFISSKLSGFSVNEVQMIFQNFNNDRNFIDDEILRLGKLKKDEPRNIFEYEKKINKLRKLKIVFNNTQSIAEKIKENKIEDLRKEFTLLKDELTFFNKDRYNFASSAEKLKEETDALKFDPVSVSKLFSIPGGHIDNIDAIKEDVQGKYGDMMGNIQSIYDSKINTLNIEMEDLIKKTKNKDEISLFLDDMKKYLEYLQKDKESQVEELKLNLAKEIEWIDKKNKVLKEEGFFKVISDFKTKINSLTQEIEKLELEDAKANKDKIKELKLKRGYKATTLREKLEAVMKEEDPLEVENKRIKLEKEKNSPQLNLVNLGKEKLTSKKDDETDEYFINDDLKSNKKRSKIDTSAGFNFEEFLKKQENILGNN